MNQKVNTWLAFALIVVLAGAVAIFARSGKDKQNQAEKTISVKKSIQTQADAQTNEPSQKAETVNWKTYKNSAYGFELKYPANLPVSEPKPGECGKGNICAITFGKVTPCKSEAECEKSAEEKANLIFAFVHSPETLKANDGKDATVNCKNRQTITLSNGLKAEKKQCQNAMDGSSEFYYTIDKNGWKYQLMRGAGKEAIKIFDEIVSSLKLTK